MDVNEVDYTPIQQLRANDSNNNYFIKREDLFPFSFGGNKARKGILFFKDIYEKKSDYIVTYGSSNSNHCRIIANMAAAKGIRCHIISPDESFNESSNSKMIEVLGATVTYTSISEVSSAIEEKIRELKEIGYNPYFIQGGGHGNLGTQAYVEVYQEIKTYEKSSNVHFDYIFHTSGTGTTQAGLICGKALNKDNREIIGISIARNNPYGEKVVLNSVNEYMEYLGEKFLCIEDIHFIDDYVLNGYGTYNKEIIDTIYEMLIYEGIPMDTTYTGKGFWGMKEYIKKNEINGKNILYIHTGGTPLFFDDMEELLNE